jgi:RNA-binding protein
MLKKALKYKLKAQAHSLKPAVLLGAKGLTPAVILETDHALMANELIKVKLTGVEREDKVQMIETICQELNAHLIQVVGHIATIYRKHPEEKAPVVKLNRQGHPIKKKSGVRRRG